MTYIEYGKKEIDYLSCRDEKLKGAIERIGFIKREADSNLFCSVIHHIIAQQISSSAQNTVWKRLQEKAGITDCKSILSLGESQVQKSGMSHIKARAIIDFAKKVDSGAFDINALEGKSDDEVIKELTSLKGVGVWTAEMIMTFGMRRQDIFSFSDFAIKRGMCLLYGYKEITKDIYEKHRIIYSPYSSIASLYLWEIAGAPLA